MKMRLGDVASTTACSSCAKACATTSHTGLSAGTVDAGIPMRALIAGPDASPSTQSP